MEIVPNLTLLVLAIKYLTYDKENLKPTTKSDVSPKAMA